MIKARRIGHAVFETPDLPRLLDYYTAVVGLVPAAREKDRAYLASQLGHLAVELRQGSQARCVELSFEVAPGTDFDEAARQLSAQGIKSERRTDPAPGISNILAFDDPKGTTIELFSSWSDLTGNHEAGGVRVFKLGHIAFFVPDPQRLVDFYVKILGFRVSDWVEDFFAFLRCNSDHHTANFLRGKTIRMHHVAFEVRDFSHLETACDLLGRKNIPIIWGPLRHGPGHNIAIYHRNPDDQIVEFFTELDQMKDEELGYFEPRPWHRDRPQRPKVWQRSNSRMIWGPPPTPEFERGRDE
jgi:catechol 2,3-dioxygenase-like lactoylglutathione lyase family enzyme